MENMGVGPAPAASAFGGFYAGKTVLVTGHTGFKGSWLAMWLHQLGAKVVGYALEPPSQPSNFDVCRVSDRVRHVHGDVRDYDHVEAVCREHRPDIVFHLAAQSLVRRSLEQPRATFEVNLMGTVNVLEAARATESVQAVVSITSDKCYLNVGWEWAYRETDQLGGYDPYSASKACAELAIANYQDPRFQRSAIAPREFLLASARAGNVIGGGDWAAGRIVPDIVRAIVADEDVVIRSPSATRPWQHVLEPLSGYLWLGRLLALEGRQHASGWNFGPGGDTALTVEAIVNHVIDRWSPRATSLVIEPDTSGAEATLLRLDCSKAAHHLRWRPTWRAEEGLDETVDWYREYYRDPARDMYPYSVERIARYVCRAREQEIAWTTS